MMVFEWIQKHWFNLKMFTLFSQTIKCKLIIKIKKTFKIPNNAQKNINVCSGCLPYGSHIELTLNLIEKDCSLSVGHTPY